MKRSNDSTLVTENTGVNGRDKQASPFSIIVAGRAESTVREIMSRLAEDPAFSVTSRLITNGHADPLHGVEKFPDALVFVLSGGWQDELEALVARPASSRPPSLIIGLDDNPQAMRLAMRAGAREFLKWPDELAEMRSVLSLIASETEHSDANELARFISVVNAKGGNGASFIASSLAHMLATREQKLTALIDMDLQFASVGSYFDQELKHGIMEVLEAVPEMDELALTGYMTHHDSGLDMLAAHGSMVGLSEEVEAERFELLMKLLGGSYQRTVLDVPRHLDYLTIQALENSDKILIVLQQNLASLKDAMRLVAILRNDLSVSKERLTAVINRFDRNADILVDDIRTALCIESTMVVANGFAEVTESLNSGVPIYESARTGKVSRSLQILCDAIEGHEVTTDSGLVKTAVSGIWRMLEHRKGE